PRRVWDLCANRVVPTTWFPRHHEHLEFPTITPVSHAWVVNDEMEYIWSNVNHNMWPIPLPRGVSIESIRQELVAHNLRFTWLDVLCLRQQIQPVSDLQSPISPDVASIREQDRLEEWQTDVPTIGMIYHQAWNVIVYLSGLGRPFQ
ncbi:hypothetical protein BDZ91DRAFT_636328, partial [Kalaharituber pfeilii]